MCLNAHVTKQDAHVTKQAATVAQLLPFDEIAKWLRVSTSYNLNKVHFEAHQFKPCKTYRAVANL